MDNNLSAFEYLFNFYQQFPSFEGFGLIVELLWDGEQAGNAIDDSMHSFVSTGCTAELVVLYQLAIIFA